MSVRFYVLFLSPQILCHEEYERIKIAVAVAVGG